MGSVVLFKLVVTNSNNPKAVPATIATTTIQQESERSTVVPTRFDGEQINSLAEEQAK